MSLLPGGGLSGGMMALHMMNIASNSIVASQFLMEHNRKLGQTFNASLTIGSPRYDLRPDLAPSVYYEHWNSGVGEVGETFISYDGNEFCSRMASSYGSHMLISSIATRYPEK